MRQKLLNEAQRSNRPFNELLQYFAMERFLYRLSRSPHARKFVLKGAMMLRAWRATLSRPTMNIDLLGRTSNSIDSIASIMREVCRHPVEPDGLMFHESSVEGQRIAEDAEYEGVRIVFRGNLATARIFMQIDIGFGDIVSPSPAIVNLPTILPLPAPELIGYTRESMTAEKFHAMVKRGTLNSRIKDFHDIWLLSRQFDFEGPALGEAMRQTFAHRDMAIPAVPESFTAAFARDEGKARQWQAFVRKNRLDAVPPAFPAVIAAIAAFLQPVIVSLAAGSDMPQRWPAPGPWQT